jgi:hypothetical protein
VLNTDRIQYDYSPLLLLGILTHDDTAVAVENII